MAININFGDNVSGSIDPAGTEIEYCLSANAGDLLTLQLTETTPALEPRIKVFDPDGIELTDQQAGGTIFLDEFVLPKNGTYTILVMDELGNDTGDYNLSLQRTNDPADPVPISYGDNITGTINPATELDAYTLQVQSGDVMTLQLTEITAALEPEIRIYNPDGSLLFSQQASGTIFIDEFEFTESGDYTILVMDELGNDTGDYNLSLQRTNDPADPVPISYGDNITGTINPATELDAYTLQVQSGDVMTLQLTEITAALEPEIRIYNPDGSLLFSQQASGTIFIDEFEFTESGDYTILVMDELGNDTGNYNLSLQKTNDPELSIALEPGVTQNGNITPSTELQTYVFSGSANDQLTFQLTELTASLEPEVRVYNPDGSLLIAQQGSGVVNIINETLPETGIYTILVMDEIGNDTGNFQFVFDLNSQDPAPINDSITGNTAPNILDGKIGNDSISARGGADNVFGSSGNDTIRGEGGNDILDGGTGNDNLQGAAGNDSLQGHPGNDRLIGGGGVDTILGWSGNDTAIGGSGNDLIFGNTGRDRLNGGGDNDTINGGSGADTIGGNNGNDRLNGDLGTDVLRGGGGNDTLTGGNGNDTLFGDAGNDRLIGGTGRDTISGGTGNDIIIAGTGADQLTGGSGVDHYNLGPINQSRLAQRDHIQDLAIGSDVLNSVKSVSAANVAQLGAVATLNEVGIRNVLSVGSFQANAAATFTFGARTFLALNDTVAGYNARNDGLLEITGFTGNLSDLRLV